ncbi:MAG: 23S rRNA (adenine(2503)-C(2))-methyltransferase RlmN [Bacteriovoracales bacterium]
MKTSFYQYTYKEMEEIFLKNDLKPQGAHLLFSWHYRQKRKDPCIVDLSKTSQKFIEDNFYFDLPEIATVHESLDRTVKFLFKLKDGKTVETVLIPFQGKYSVCLSTQVGCQMNCSFCFTGTQGLTRNLSTDEIVGQFLEVSRWLKNARPDDCKILNVVFMGQGEPMHNFDAVKTACEIFLCKIGISLAALRITVSTAGYLPGLKRWNEMPGVNLALSLHSPFEEKRNKLIPLNKRYPLPEILSAIDIIPLKRKQFITYEYLIIKDLNDSIEDAHTTGKLLQGKTAIVNLIPFNPFPGSQYQRPEEEKVERFKEIMKSYGLPTMVRVTKGDDILAACGQLNTFSK